MEIRTIQPFLQYFGSVRERTMRVARCIPPDKLDWSYAPGKFTLGDLLRLDYDWSTEAAAITAPTLIVLGDADGIPPMHGVEFFELLGGGKRDGGWDGAGMSNARLAILPGITHYTIFSSPALPSAVVPFLDGPYPA